MPEGTYLERVMTELIVRGNRACLDRVMSDTLIREFVCGEYQFTVEADGVRAAVGFWKGDYSILVNEETEALRFNDGGLVYEQTMRGALLSSLLERKKVDGEHYRWPDAEAIRRYLNFRIFLCAKDVVTFRVLQPGRNGEAGWGSGFSLCRKDW